MIVLGNGSNSWEESSLSSGISNHNGDHSFPSTVDYHRLSNADSGIVSIRSSSYSKRSSQQSSLSCSQFHISSSKQQASSSEVVS